jgi:magnesium-transporting ATPase (P-type)
VPAYRQTVEAVITQFHSDAARGLTSATAKEELARCGPNELPTVPPEPAWKRFLAQFQNPLTMLLIVATVISFVAWVIEEEGGLPYEALTILAIVILNAVLGYVQENRAEQAVAALQAMSSPTSRVLRDGQQQQIPTREVVPGDILLIEEGDTLPADGRMIESIAMRVAEAALTGESTSVSKDSDPIADEVGIADQQNMIFSGTAVAWGAVKPSCRTGPDTGLQHRGHVAAAGTHAAAKN